LIGCLAGCLRDERQAGKVDHSLKNFWRARILDRLRLSRANDAARLAAIDSQDAPGPRSGRGRDLASQPTLSRFENASE